MHIPSRERTVYDKIAKLNKGPLTDAAIQAIYREIMSASISLQKDVTIAYLGVSKSMPNGLASLRDHTRVKQQPANSVIQ